MKPVWSTCSGSAGRMVTHVQGVVIGDAVSTVRACCFSAVRVSIRFRSQQGRKPGPPGRGAIGKSKVVIAVESRDKHAGFAVMQHVPAVDSDQIFSIAQDKIQPASDVRTDGWRAYQTLGSKGFVHESVIVSKDKQALKQLKWVHLMIANVKGNIRGVYHGVSSKHLGRYLAEFSYRFNRRYWDSQLFNRTVTACLTTSTVTFAELKA